MKLYIVAGEASGDLHASNLVKMLQAENKPGAGEIQCRGFGGDCMKEAGVQIVRHYRDTAFMGFWEVMKNLSKILGFIDFCKKDIEQWKPDALILVDYPGFNLRIAEWARKKRLRVFYYISPQVWAWKASRVKKIKRDVDQMLVILPFEKDFYAKHNYEVEFVGHPLLDAVMDFKNEPLALPSSRPVVALLPGSRRQEVASILPSMLATAHHFPDFQFIAAGLSSVGKEFYSTLMKNSPVEIVFDQTYSLLAASRAALVASGTATLETALFKVPQVVCYRGSMASYLIAVRLIEVKYISLVNLILDRPLLRELIQKELTVQNFVSELNKLLFDEKVKTEMAAGYAELQEKLGKEGASRRAARLILQKLNR
jgi:lipid-A-disaccharide synthase